MPTKTPIKLETKKVPKLRFPGFSDSWQKKKLKDILVEHKARNVGNKYVEVFSVAKEKGVINQIEHLGRSFAAKNLTNYKVVFPDDVIYTKSPTANFPYGIIKQNRTNRIGIVSTLYAVYRPQNKYIGYLIHEYFLSWVHTYNYLVPLVQKGAKNTINISNNDFLNGSILCLPLSEKEQQKIAGFLIVVDEWIENLREQKETLEQYKKGMMQNIFSQKIRFKDDNGKDFPKWEEKKIKEVGKICNSSVDKKIIDGQELVLLLNYMDVYKRNRIYSKDKFQEVSATPLQVKSCDLIEGDILFTPTSETPDDIGHSAVVMENLNKVLFSYHLIRLRPESIVLNKDFSAYAFHNFSFYKKLWRIAQGATRFVLPKDGFEKTTINIPKSREEQKKIAEFLTSIDKIIESRQQQITQAKQWKKGLMQQLFV